jgi:ATP-binding cassette subfamily C protein
MMIAGLVEGLALASVVPLLSAVGVGHVQGEGGGGMLAELAITVLGILGIPPSLNAIAGFVLVALLISTILFLTQAYLGVRLQTNYVYAWQSRLIRAAFSARLEYFHRRRHGDIVNAVVTEAQRLGGAFYQLGLLLTGVVHGLIFLAIAASLSVPITLTVLTGGALLFLLTRPLVHRAYRIGTGISEANADLQTMVTDFVSGAKLLKATATEQQAVSRLRGVAERLRAHFFSNSFDIQIAKGAFDFGAAAMVAGILFGSHLLLGADPAITLVVLAIFVRLMPKLSGIQQSLQSLSLSIPAVQVVNEIARSAEEAVESTMDSSLPASLADGPFSIRLHDVTVRHGDLVALHNVGLTIPAGACVALVGGSGAGKSTLVDAILGLVPLGGGSIEINNHALATLPLGELRRRVGYMTQEAVLFQGTVRENVLWGRGDDSDHIALEALQMAAAVDLVQRLPAGLDTVIGNRGSSLSGGERQRLGLARALVGSPGLLILDEATSALDAETETVVTDALRHLKGKVTILMIAHRLSSVRLADEIHVLDHGAIVESGTWSELTRHESRFAGLWRLQTNSPEE